MDRIGRFVRLLMLATCLVPFTSPRQASDVLPLSTAAPDLPPAAPTPAPTGLAGSQGQSEDETVQEGRGGGKRVGVKVAGGHTARPGHPEGRLPPEPPAGLAFPTHPPPAPAPLTSRATADPFCNGLGSPYRC